MMTRWLFRILVIAGALTKGAPLLAIDWPMDPPDQAQPLGNSYGEYQYYGGSPYYHPGIDILQPAGTLVRAIKSGYVKAILTTSADLHWRVAIGDSAGAAACDGWLYAHLEQFSIAVLQGDWVDEGQYIGQLVTWPIADFHHLHFVKIRHAGNPWNSGWDFIANPLDELAVTTDPDAPVIENVSAGRRFGYYDVDDHVYLPSGAILSGPIDIIAKVNDRIGHPTWRLAPYAITYEIFNDTLSTGPINSVTFTGQLFWDEFVTVVYNDDGVYNSRGDYDSRDFYFRVTNTDGDSVIEASDASGAWHTEEFNNGDWWVKVAASDRAGNVAAESALVTTANFFPLAGTAIPCDADPNPAGAIVTAANVSGSPADTCGAGGAFSFSNLTLGQVQLHIERFGYETIDTTLAIPGASELDLLLRPDYLVGDLNGDGFRDALDLSRIIEVIFYNSDQWPTPYWSGDLNFDRYFDALDLNLLIDHIFFGAPAPGDPVCHP